MSGYLLDTNAVIAVLNDSQSVLAKRLRRHKPDSVCVSAIVLHELYFGAFKSRRIEHNIALLDQHLRFQILEFEADDAREAGRVRAVLSQIGTPIGPYDVLIAGQALARGLILVSAKLREFRRIDGLKVENWESQ